MSDAVLDCFPDIADADRALIDFEVKDGPSFTIFDAVGMKRLEIRHSAFIAWLLEPSEKHGLGDEFAQRIVALLAERSPEPGYDGFREAVSSGLLSDLANATVVRESEAHIDLLFKTVGPQRLGGRRLVICIENKVDSWLHDDQLQRYREYVEREYAEYDHRVFVFLSPSGTRVPPPEDDPDLWIPLSYADIRHCLPNGERPGGTGIEARNRQRALLYVEEYAEFVRKNLMVDRERNVAIERLYARHREVFDEVLAMLAARESGAVRDEIASVLDRVLDEPQFRTRFKRSGDVDHRKYLGIRSCHIEKRVLVDESSMQRAREESYWVSYWLNISDLAGVGLVLESVNATDDPSIRETYSVLRQSYGRCSHAGAHHSDFGKETMLWLESSSEVEVDELGILVDEARVARLIAELLETALRREDEVLVAMGAR